MRLLMLDLDNTLVDRAAAFHAWAHDFVTAVGGGSDDVDAVVRFDGDGFVPREQTADLIAERFGLTDEKRSGLVGTMRGGLVDRMSLEPTVAAALRAARDDAGWRLAIVTNGTQEQQERKIRHLGLDRFVDAWVVSEAVGVRKPDPRIFAIAARAADADLDGAWMVGDSPDADIAGAVSARIRSAWISRGRTWAKTEIFPTVVVDTVAEAIACAVASID